MGKKVKKFVPETVQQGFADASAICEQVEKEAHLRGFKDGIEAAAKVLNARAEKHSKNACDNTDFIELQRAHEAIDCAHDISILPSPEDKTNG